MNNPHREDQQRTYLELADGVLVETSPVGEVIEVDGLLIEATQVDEITDPTEGQDR